MSNSSALDRVTSEFIFTRCAGQIHGDVDLFAIQISSGRDTSKEGSCTLRIRRATRETSAPNNP